MTSTSVCPGCRVVLPANGWGSDGRLNASAECEQVLGEVAAFELSHPEELGQRFHQLLVDTYGAQHAPEVVGNVPNIRVAYSLVGLYLALDRGLSGMRVRAAHQRMGKPDTSWPPFPPPAEPGPVTVLNLANAGVRADSVDGHAEWMQRWAASVWHSWSPQRLAVVSLAERLLGKSF